MLKAQDIRVVTFDKGMRGYNPVDVDAFLAQVADQVELMESQKAEIEKKLYMLAEKVAGRRIVTPRDFDYLSMRILDSTRMYVSAMLRLL